MNESTDKTSVATTNVACNEPQPIDDATEEWRPVVGYEGLYEVSSLGRVRNPRKNKFIQRRSSRGGCCSVRLYDKNAHLKSWPLHIVVASAFLPRPDGSIKVEHIDGDVKNNSVSNLRWAEPPESAEGLPGEIWEPIEIVGGAYEISSLGRVRGTLQGTSTPYIVRSTKDRCGIPHVYMRIVDQSSGVTSRVHYPVHALVAKAFLHKPEGASRIVHLDGDYTNNNVNNLRWIDPGVDVDAEIWRPLTVYDILVDTYEISNVGHIRNKSTGAILADSNNQGYRIIRLYTNAGDRASFGVHRLVAATFLEQPSGERKCVDHINGDPADNRVENLRWATPQENNNNPVTRARAASILVAINKTKNSRAVLCINTGETFRSVREAAAHFGIKETTVGKSCRDYYKPKKYRIKTRGGKELLRFKWADEPQHQLNDCMYQQPAVDHSPLGRKVRCVETGIVYPSILTASRLLGLSRSSISNSCKRHAAHIGSPIVYMGDRKCVHFMWAD